MSDDKACAALTHVTSELAEARRGWHDADEARITAISAKNEAIRELADARAALTKAESTIADLRIGQRNDDRDHREIVAQLAKAEEERDGLNAGWKLAQERWRGEEFDMKAALGRTVAILPDALKWIEAETIQLKDATPYDACIARIRAVLADPTCAAAGKAWANGKAELTILRRLERAVFTGDALSCSPDVPQILTEYLEWSRAKVDAPTGDS